MFEIVLRVLLLLVFVGHGIAFVKQPPAVAAQLRDGPLSPFQFRMLGIAEIAGGIAVVAAPPLDLTAIYVAALIGMAIVLVGAIVLHIRRSEPPATVMGVVFLAATAGLLAMA